MFCNSVNARSKQIGVSNGTRQQAGFSTNISDIIRNVCNQVFLRPRRGQSDHHCQNVQIVGTFLILLQLIANRTVAFSITASSSKTITPSQINQSLNDRFPRLPTAILHYQELLYSPTIIANEALHTAELQTRNGFQRDDLIASSSLATEGSRIHSLGGNGDVKFEDGDPDAKANENQNNDRQQSSVDAEKKRFAIELLKMLHEQYGTSSADKKTSSSTYGGGNKVFENRQSTGSSLGGIMSQLLEAIGSNGDVRRLIDWVRNSFSPALMSELTTHFIVSKLGSVNCPALLNPDREETLIPRFLLFNEHFVDVPFELSLSPLENECLLNAKFDPTRRTIVLVHGFLAGYTLVDGITNIKNRILDMNSFTRERALESFVRASQNNSSYILTDDLQSKVRQQLYNVIIVDWFKGANPIPRANYIRAAVNSQVVGRLIARFLGALIEQCGTSAEHLQIIAHSLGCHVSGFAGKALAAAGHRIGKITHLDPVGLCFGRLFSQPQFRLSPNDATATQAVHVSLNIFDNPLDGAHINFLVNGGRDQIGCGGGPTEVKNSTSSSVSLVFDPAARFAPCSHIRALALFEENLSSEPSQCQMVGYRCPNYNRFLDGKCGYCDAQNGQCRLMSIPPINLKFRKLTLMDESSSNLVSRAAVLAQSSSDPWLSYELDSSPSVKLQQHSLFSQSNDGDYYTNGQVQPYYYSLIPEDSMIDHGYVKRHDETSIKYTQPIASGDELKERSDRRLDQPHNKRFAQVIDKLRQDTRAAIAEGWTNLRGFRNEPHTHSNKQISEASDDNEASAATLQALSTPSAPASPSSVAKIASLHGLHPMASPDTGEKVTLSLTSAKLAQPQPTTTTTTTTITAATTMTGLSATQTTSAPMNQHNNKHQQQFPDPLDVIPSDRLHEEPLDQIPLGGQAIPRDSVNSPLFFLGTGSMSPYCVNYYQFRALIAESRIRRFIGSHALAPNRMASPILQHTITGSVANMRQRVEQAGSRDMLHLTVKLSDSSGHFFKGFSMLENARFATRVTNEPTIQSDGHQSFGLPSLRQQNEQMLELTMLLNTTRAEPIKIGETIISYYFHPIVLADRVEINYMSNISPEIRARYSSVLCPVAINDRYQLVRYVECHKIAR